MTRFARTLLLALCGTGLLAYQGEIKAQSGVIPAAKKVDAQSRVVQSANEARCDDSRVDGKAAVSADEGAFGFPFLHRYRVAGVSGDSTAEDCGPDKGKCSGTGHCCLVGSSGWCCPKDKACDYDNISCK